MKITAATEGVTQVRVGEAKNVHREIACFRKQATSFRKRGRGFCRLTPRRRANLRAGWGEPQAEANRPSATTARIGFVGIYTRSRLVPLLGFTVGSAQPTGDYIHSRRQRSKAIRHRRVSAFHQHPLHTKIPALIDHNQQRLGNHAILQIQPREV